MEAIDASALHNSENASMVKGFDEESNVLSKKKRRKKGQARHLSFRRPSKKIKESKLSTRKYDHNAHVKCKEDSEIF